MLCKLLKKIRFTTVYFENYKKNLFKGHFDLRKLVYTYIIFTLNFVWILFTFSSWTFKNVHKLPCYLKTETKTKGKNIHACFRTEQAELFENQYIVILQMTVLTKPVGPITFNWQKIQIIFGKTLFEFKLTTNKA